jgi:hypothetical protein
MRNAYTILIRKPEGKKPAGIIILKLVFKTGREVVNWIQMAQDRVQG